MIAMMQHARLLLAAAQNLPAARSKRWRASAGAAPRTCTMAMHHVMVAQHHYTEDCQLLPRYSPPELGAGQRNTLNFTHKGLIQILTRSANISPDFSGTGEASRQLPAHLGQTSA